MVETFLRQINRASQNSIYILAYLFTFLLS